MDGIRLPGSAASASPELPEKTDAYIINPHCGKEYLTVFEALDVINNLSAMLMADTRFRMVQSGNRKTG